MAFEFADEFNREVYAEWHQPLLERLFGHMIDLHYDLYELTHSHRRDHNGDVDHGLCTAWPSPPYRAPVWRLIVEKIGAKRFLEVGTAIGYTAALMADAGGPESQLDTIEIDPGHADRVEAELTKRGLSDKVHVLRGDAVSILPMLTRPYDVVFADGGNGDIRNDLNRLTRPGGASVEIKSRLREPLIRVLEELRDTLACGNKADIVALSNARDSYRKAVWAVLEPSPER